MNNVYQPTLHGNIKRFARNSLCSLVLAASLGFGGCAIDKNDNGRKKAVITLIEKYENSGRSRKAAELAQEAGLTERAIEIYEKFGHGRKAAELAQEAGLTERAIEIYETFGHSRKAAELAQKTGMTEKAIELYEIVGEYDQAARLAYKIGKNRRTVELYKKHYACGQEIRRFRYATRRHDKKLIRVKTEVQLALEAGLTEEAIEIYEAAYYHENAARLAERMGKLESAMEIYEKNGILPDAARIADKLGMPERAGEFRKRWRYAQAAAYMEREAAAEKEASRRFSRQPLIFRGAVQKDAHGRVIRNGDGYDPYTALRPRRKR